MQPETSIGLSHSHPCEGGQPYHDVGSSGNQDECYIKSKQVEKDQKVTDSINNCPEVKPIKKGTKSWFSTFFGSFKKKKDYINCNDLQTQTNVSKEDLHTSSQDWPAGTIVQESIEVNDMLTPKKQIDEQDVAEASIMENCQEQEEKNEIKGKKAEVITSFSAGPKKKQIPVPPPLPPKKIDRSHPGDVSSIAQRFNKPDKPMVPKAIKTQSYLKDDALGVNLGMRRAATLTRKATNDDQGTTTETKQNSLSSGTNSLDRVEDGSEPVSYVQSEENRVKKLMKGWHKGVPIKAQALGEEDQEPEVENLAVNMSFDKSSCKPPPPPRNETISSIRDKFKADEQQVKREHISVDYPQIDGVKSVVKKFDLPSRFSKKECSKDSNFSQALMMFQEERKTSPKQT